MEDPFNISLRASTGSRIFNPGISRTGLAWNLYPGILPKKYGISPDYLLSSVEDKRSWKVCTMIFLFLTEPKISQLMLVVVVDQIFAKFLFSGGDRLSPPPPPSTYCTSKTPSSQFFTFQHSTGSPQTICTNVHYRNPIHYSIQNSELYMSWFIYIIGYYA